ncbi:hypothetical protein ACO9S2_16435 [Nitrospira sp. NS4]|uniref:hypothetical protein n=1 Tax=Nitrospira sp. NS4 TaxID=3414498 RepID=UPI003C2D8F17
MRVPALAVVVSIFMMLGCASSYDKAFRTWDSWIGSGKDDRVKDLGIPTRCHAFTKGGEACEWPVRWSPDATGTMTLQFDQKGLLCHWTYRDRFGDRPSQSQCP